MLPDPPAYQPVASAKVGDAMRVYIWHGYLLHGTGSNEFTRGLALTMALQGHEVVVFCQEPEPGNLDLGGARVIRPPLPGRLPVFVLDRYEGVEPALLPSMPRDEVDQFVEAQVASIKAAGPADLLITNHVLLGGPVGAGSGLRYIVKVHGSELEFAMRGHAELCQWAGETLAPAQAVIVGSEHVGRVTLDLVGSGIPQPVVVTPGVNIEMMAPQEPQDALAGLIAEAGLDHANDNNERLPDPDNAARFSRFLAEPDRPTLVYVGKLSREKGVHLLLDAMDGLQARAVIVGFGPARAALEDQAQRMGLDVLFTGPLQHRHLRHLWALATASVVPSVFPEAFGMVAAEAAACGCPPVVARHSGLAEVGAWIESHLPDDVRITFDTNDTEDLRRRLAGLIALTGSQRAQVSAGCRRAVKERWSWEVVADRLIELGARP